MSAAPSVGVVILDNTFRRVLFPAPLSPIIPTFSPLAILKEASFSAQKNDDFSASFSPRRNKLPAADCNASRSELCRPSFEPSRYRFPRFCAEMAISDLISNPRKSVPSSERIRGHR